MPIRCGVPSASAPVLSGLRTANWLSERFSAKSGAPRTSRETRLQLDVELDVERHAAAQVVMEETVEQWDGIVAGVAVSWAWQIQIVLRWLVEKALLSRPLEVLQIQREQN